MSVWHGDQHKKKVSGGRKRRYRSKRKFEHGFFPAETTLGKTRMKITCGHGGRKKIRLLSVKNANVTSSSGKTRKVEILRVLKNPTNVDYNRRGVITKGATIETNLGTARVTSRPGQNGVINAILVSKASVK